MKKIWIVNYYTAPPDYVSNPRHLEFAENLVMAGYDVTIFSSGFLSDKGIDLVPDEKKFVRANYGKHNFVHIKVKHFVGNGLSRMFSIFQFAWRIFVLRKKFEKPDIILHNIHAPFDYPIVWCAKRLKARYIVEAWDLWPESFVRFGLIKENNPLTKLSFAVERKLYENADKIIFTFEGGKDYLKKMKWDKSNKGKVDLKKVNYINNGVNIEKFNFDKENFTIKDSDLENDKIFKVVYLGSIRLVNNIKTLIDAAQILATYSHIKFLIYGDGNDRAFLEKYCIEQGISNVVFKEKWIELKYVPFVLSKSSVNIMNYQKDFGKYGVSSGKLFQYLASGKPICANIKMNYCLIEKHQLGIAKNLDTPEEYADAIFNLAQLDQSAYSEMCARVKNVAKEFDYTVLSAKLIKVLK